MNDDLQINKGVEIMLRRLDKEPEKSGFKSRQSFKLLSKIFFFRFEFTWEDTK